VTNRPMSTSESSLRQAIQAAKAGRRAEALELLLNLVEADPHRELAWLWLSELVADPQDKIIALENALALNNRPAVAQRLEKLRQQYGPPAPLPLEFDSEPLFIEPEPQPDDKVWHYTPPKPPEDPLLMQARAYEEAGELKQAIKAYRKAKRKAKSAVDSYRAEQRLVEVEEQYRLSRIKETSPLTRLIRLTTGPVLVYGMLLFIHGGFSLLQMNPLLCFGGLPLLLGSLLVVGVTQFPHHTFWQELLGESGLRKRPLRLLLHMAGLLLLIAPFLLIYLDARQRLTHFQPVLPF
jgi:tetratricopeptide (TPR) repeat protein